MAAKAVAVRELLLSAVRNARERGEDIFRRRHGGEWVKRCGRKPSLEQTPVKLPDAAANGIAATYPGTKQALASRRASCQASLTGKPASAADSLPAEHRQSRRAPPSRQNIDKPASAAPATRQNIGKPASAPSRQNIGKPASAADSLPAEHRQAGERRASHPAEYRQASERRAKPPGRTSASRRAPRASLRKSIGKPASAPPRHIDKTTSAAGAWLRGACPHCGGSYFFFFGLAASSSA